MHGREHLNRVLDKFTQNCNRINEIFRNKPSVHITPEKIEKIKRYFILSLIGLDVPDDYINNLKRKMAITRDKLHRINQIEIPEVSKKIVYLEMLVDGKHIDDDDKKFIDEYIICVGSLEEGLELTRKTLNSLKFQRNVDNRKKRDYDEMFDYAY